MPAKARTPKMKSPKSPKVKTPQRVGSYAQVFHGTAMKTAGDLEKKDLMKIKLPGSYRRKDGTMGAKYRIVSKKKHAAGLKRLAWLKKNKPEAYAAWQANKFAKKGKKNGTKKNTGRVVKMSPAKKGKNTRRR